LEGPLTKQDLKKLDKLIARQAGIENLSGLEYAANLTGLYLRANQITDISPLASLTNLTTLPLVENQVFECGTSQTIVVFPDKNLEAAVRKALEKLEGPLTKQDLKKLDKLIVRQAGIENLSGLEYAANLTTLTLDENQITDISPLASLTNLTGLHLRANQITDISPLASLTNLTTLYLDDKEVTDIRLLFLFLKKEGTPESG
jgi:Leucine-rich repeat (LRR) protein